MSENTNINIFTITLLQDNINVNTSQFDITQMEEDDVVAIKEEDE